MAPFRIIEADARQQVEHSRLMLRGGGAGVVIVLVVIFLPAMFDEAPTLSSSGEAVPPRPQWEFVPLEPHLNTGFEAPGEASAAPAGASAVGQVSTYSERSAEAEVTPAPVAAPESRPPSGDRVTEREEPAPVDLAVTDPVGGGAAAIEAGRGRAESIETDSAADGRGSGPSRGASRATGQWHEVKVGRGDSLYGIFTRLGLSASQLKELTGLNARTAKLSQLRPGQRFRLFIEPEGRLRELVYLRSGGRSLHLVRGDAGWKAMGPPVASPPASTPKSEARPLPSTASAKATARPTTAAKPEAAAAWVVQLASLTKEARALALQDRLRRKGYAAFLRSAYVRGGKVWRVKVGPELRRSQAVKLRAELEREMGLAGLVQPYP